MEVLKEIMLGVFASFKDHGIVHDLLPEPGIKEWWLPLDDTAGGALKGAGKAQNILDLTKYRERDCQAMVEAIIRHAPEKVILVYNSFAAASCWNFLNFLKAFWGNREKITSSLKLYVPAKKIFAQIHAEGEIFAEKNFKTIVADKESTSNLPDYADYINSIQNDMPFFDFEEKEFRLEEFYEFCGRKLAYIIQHEQLFPRLDSGMTDFNTKVWNVFRAKVLLHWSLGTEYSFQHGQTLRLWKLLDHKALPWLPVNHFCRNAWDNRCWDQFPYSCYKLPKNRLAKAIFLKDEYDDEAKFLFPLAIFLGHYAKYGDTECYIPEYNFHELINALIAIMRGKDIPELLPDIPGETEISLEAYRRGYIKLTPLCRSYDCRNGKITAVFKNVDAGYEFIEKIRNEIDGEFCLGDFSGKFIFRNISDQSQLLNALDEAKNVFPEYRINMQLWDGTRLRKMSVNEILLDAAARITRFFPYDIRRALHYLENLSRKFKNQYRRGSVVR